MKPIGVIFEAGLDEIKKDVHDYFSRTLRVFGNCEVRKTEKGLEALVYYGDDHFRILNEQSFMNLISKIYNLCVYQIEFDQIFNIVKIFSLIQKPSDVLH